MTPLQIEILLWYHSRMTDFREGDFSAPAVRAAIDAFRDETKLIETIPREKLATNVNYTYRLTDRGRAYVDALMTLPLPVCRWEIPASAA